MNWRNDPPSEKQITLLNSLNLEIPKTKGEASDIIGKDSKALRKIEDKKIDIRIKYGDLRDYVDIGYDLDDFF